MPLMNKSDLKNQLQAYLEKRDEVVMAFLFGSRQTGRERRVSDWDIGVYLTREDRVVESEIWRALEGIVGTEVDLVVLNRAPAIIAWRILATGKELTNKDRGLFLDFMFRVSQEANDFYATAQEYHEVFQRSASLAVPDKNRVNRILEFIEEEVREYTRFRVLTFKEYADDRVQKRNVEHWIEHLVIAATDIAKIILASERRTIPETYRDMVLELGTISPFSKDNLCEKVVPWVQLRNILAHEYLDLRWKNISAFIQETEPSWQEIISRTKEFLSSKE